MFRRMRRDEDGQAAPIVLVALVALAGTAVLFVQGGRMGLLAAEAATGADAAALAALRVVHDELEGPDHGLGFIVSGKVPRPVEVAAYSAARDYAASNGTELTDFDVIEDQRRRIAVRVETRSLEELGEPALNDDIRTFRATSRGAGEVELSFLEPGNGGCLTAAEVSAVGSDIGVPARPDSGLVDCGGADVRNLAPIMHEAVIRIESVMDAPVRFTSAFRSLEEQLELFLDPTVNPAAPPGQSLHNFGLAFDAANYAAIAAAVNSGPDDMVHLCQPMPDIDAVHFSHEDGFECPGGSLPGAGHGLGVLGIEVSDPRLIDPDTL